MGLEILVHQRFHLVMVVGAEGEEAEIVAEEGDRVLVAEEAREFLEERAFMRLLDMLLEDERALGLGHLEDGVEQGQQFEVAPPCRTSRP